MADLTTGVCGGGGETFYDGEMVWVWWMVGGFGLKEG
jgi:hypothetical protein